MLKLSILIRECKVSSTPTHAPYISCSERSEETKTISSGVDGLLAFTSR